MSPSNTAVKKGLLATLAVAAAVVGVLVVYTTARSMLAPANEWKQLRAVTAAAPVPSASTAPAAPAGSPSPAASPAPLGDGRTTTIVNAATQKCIDDPASKTDENTQLIIWDCDANKPNQSWTYTRRGELQVLGKCLDAANGQTAPGTPAAIRECTGRTSERWTLGATGRLVSALTGLCVEVTDGKSDNGTPLQLATCSDTASQRWSRG